MSEQREIKGEKGVNGIVPADPRDRIGIGMLGYAFMGKAHSNAFRQAPFFFPDSPIAKLVAICGRSDSKVQEIASRYSYRRYYTDWQRMIMDKDVQIVDNGLPNNFHLKPCVLAAELGKHLICEKPLGMNALESKEMVRSVRKAGVKHMVGYNYRFIPAIILARKMISDGDIGKILQFRAAYLQEWIMGADFPMVWRLRRSTAGSGVLGDLGSHIIDLARYLVGDIESTVGIMKTFIKKRPIVEGEKLSSSARAPAKNKLGTVDVDDAFIALLKFRSGVIGSAEASRFCAGRKNFQRIEVHGTEGSISFNLERLNELEVYSNRDAMDRRGFRRISVTEAVHPYYKNWWPHGHVLGWEHTFIHEMYHFLKAVSKDENVGPQGATFEDGLAVDLVMDAISKSAESGMWEKVQST